MIEISGKTRQLAVIGNPISHSFSPQLHTYIADKLGLDYVYTALRVREEELDKAIEGIRALNFAGINITSPYKFRVLDMMDGLSDKAKKYGSVNTCVNRDGKLYGYTTDADGFYRSLLVEGIDIKGKDILFIGAGGATQPVVLLFAELGAKSISIVNRTVEKAQRLAEYTKKITGFDVEIGINKKHYDVVINTTTVGMHPDTDKCPVSDMPYVDEKTAVADMIYNPEKTMFLKMAEKKGAKIVNGLGMLIFQGIIAFELFTGAKVTDDMYYDIMRDVFKAEKEKA
ncbi:MAG: shikimate dehydrogenase [Clostridia bacterium]|nr:shikimate dehydrogenase [Clostridia bacterium]